MTFIDFVIGVIILTVHAMIVFDILDDASKEKITKGEAGFFTLVFSIFAVVGLVIVFF